MLEGVIFQASRQYFNKLANDFRKLGMSQMSSNSKNESLIGSEELGATDETVSFDATGEEVRLFEGQGM